MMSNLSCGCCEYCPNCICQKCQISKPINILTGYFGFATMGDGSIDNHGNVNHVYIAISYEERKTDVRIDVSRGDDDFAVAFGNGSQSKAFNSKVIAASRHSAVIQFQIEDKYPNSSPCQLVYTQSHAYLRIVEIDDEGEDVIGGGDKGTSPVITSPALPIAVSGEMYNFALEADGTIPITWSIISGTLPAGLTFRDDGVIFGTTTAIGSYMINIKAVNEIGESARQFTLIVDHPEVIDIPDPVGDEVDHFSDLPLTGNTVGDVKFVRNPPTGTYYQWDGSKWNFLQYADCNCCTSCPFCSCPTCVMVPHTWKFTVKAQNATGDNEKILLITIHSRVPDGDCECSSCRGENLDDDIPPSNDIPPTITSGGSATLTSGQGGTFQVTATGTPPITYQLTGAPAGVSINSVTGLITFANTIEVGTSTFTIVALNGTVPGIKTFTLTVVAAAVAPTITSGNSITVLSGTGGNFQVTANGTTPITYSLSGAPSGITINSSTGVISISGSVAVGNSTFNVIASNGTLPNATQSFTVTVNAVSIAPTITSSNSASFVKGTNGSFQVTASGTAPITYSLSGAPSGITINSSSGWISVNGSIAAGDHTFTITASNGTTPNATQSFKVSMKASSNGCGYCPGCQSGGTCTGCGDCDGCKANQSCIQCGCCPNCPKCTCPTCTVPKDVPYNQLSGYSGFTTKGDGFIDANGDVNHAYITINYDEKDNDVRVEISNSPTAFAIAFGNGTQVRAFNPKVITINPHSAIIQFEIDGRYPNSSPCQLVYISQSSFIRIVDVIRPACDCCDDCPKCNCGHYLFINEVENISDLPTTGNTMGDIIFVKNPVPGQYYKWNGSQWVLVNIATVSGDAVDNVSDLPTTGNEIGDTIFVRNPAPGRYYRWNGSIWTTRSNVNTVANLPTVGNAIGDIIFVENPAPGRYYKWTGTEWIALDDVENREDLPTTGNQIGDVRFVRNPAPGRYYQWDGERWSLVSPIIVNGDEVDNSTQLPTTGNKIGDVRFVKYPSPGRYYQWDGTTWIALENEETCQIISGCGCCEDCPKCNCWSCKVTSCNCCEDCPDCDHEDCRSCGCCNECPKCDCGRHIFANVVNNISDLPMTGNYVGRVISVRYPAPDRYLRWSGSLWVLMESVAEHSDLPTHGNQIGDIIFVSDPAPGRYYQWDGSTWNLVTIHNVNGQDVDYVSHLPTTGNEIGDIRFVKNPSPGSHYRWNGEAWIQISTTECEAKGCGCCAYCPKCECAHCKITGCNCCINCPKCNCHDCTVPRTADDVIIGNPTNNMTNFAGFTTKGDGHIDNEGDVDHVYITMTYDEKPYDVEIHVSRGYHDFSVIFGNGVLLRAFNPKVIAESRHSGVVQFQLEDRYPNSSPCTLTFTTDAAFIRVVEKK